jgi:hypothetical protein
MFRQHSLSSSAQLLRTLVIQHPIEEEGERVKSGRVMQIKNGTCSFASSIIVETRTLPSVENEINYHKNRKKKEKKETKMAMKLCLW